MKNLRIILVLLVVITMIMCNNRKKKFVNNLSECTYYDNTIFYDKEIYPFAVDSVEYKTVKESLCKDVVLDSFRFINHDNNKDYILRISDSISEIKFYRFKYEKSRVAYSLFKYSVTSNLIKYKNGICIGMGRNEFFRNMKVTYSECDTFLLSDASFFYHLFVFEKNRLKKIERLMPEL